MAFVGWLSEAGRSTISGVGRTSRFFLAKPHMTVHDLLMKMTIRSISSVNSWLRWSVLLLVSCLIGCFAISPNAQAVTPPPDGGYPGANTAEGDNALLSLTTGTFNTAIGAFALRNTTTAIFNTATGVNALLTNRTGSNNTATGAGALFNNTASDNSAHGHQTLFHNTTGDFNTANGFDALLDNTTGDDNTATGAAAL